MKIAPKIASAIGGVTLVALAVLLVLNKWSFDQGFVDYLNEQEQARLDRMALDLAQIYERNGGWDPLPRSRIVEDVRRSGERGPPLHPPKHRPPSGHSQPNHPPPRGGGPPPPRMSETELRDAQGRVLVGRVPGDQDLLRVDIIVSGARVGEIVTAVKTRLHEEDAAFASTQFQISALTSLVLFGVALLVAVLLSRTLTRPIQQTLELAVWV